MQRLEVSCAVRSIYGSLGVKRLIRKLAMLHYPDLSSQLQIYLNVMFYIIGLFLTFARGLALKVLLYIHALSPRRLAFVASYISLSHKD